MYRLVVLSAAIASVYVTHFFRVDREDDEVIT
jgi:hypothetical protein